MDRNQYLFQNQIHFSRKFSAIINEKLSAHGLYSGQWSIIYLLKQQQPISQARICEHLNVEAPTMTRTIKRLEMNGWVERVAGKDKREKLIKITQSALEKYPIWQREVRLIEEKILADITREEQESLDKTIQKMLENIQGLR